MRTIKFRGLNEGQWVYGSYVKTGFGLHYILPQNVITDGIPQYIVDEKSIGEYTGIKDRNGKDIYEGDIWLEDGLPQVVEMIDGCWQSVGRTPEGDIYDKQTFDLVDFRYIEVVGNKCENPELLPA